MTKRVLSVLVAVLMVMALIPMAVFASGNAKTAAVNPTKSRVAPVDYEPPAEGNARVVLTAGDVWQDGTGYQMLLDADATAYGSIIPEQGGLTSSGAADETIYGEFEYKIPENADGALDTQNIILNSTGTVEVPAGTYDWCIANPTPDDRVWIASDQGTIGGRYDDYAFEDGYTYVFTVALGGQNDKVDLEIIDPSGESNVETPLFGYYFESDPAEEGWIFEDADGDGHNWAWATANSSYPAYEGEGCIWSASYDGGALTPDNWAFSPEFEVPAVNPYATFWTRSYSSSYPEKLEAYVVVDGDPVGAVEQFDAPSAYDQYTIDLADYAGQTVQLAFRNYGTNDMWRVMLDAVEVYGEDASEPMSELDEALNVAGGKLHFETGEDYPWAVFEDGDRLAAWSTNNGVSGSTSTVSTTVNANEGDTLSFDFMAWGEGTSTYWDKCEFKVDGVTVQSWGALQNNDWETYTYTFTAGGEHELTWSYTKDSSVNPTGDYFAVDEVALTTGEPVVTPEPSETEPVVTPEPSEPTEGLIVGYYFETEEEANMWTNVDADGDGYGWYWLGYGINQTTGNMAYEGIGNMTSASYQGTALTPDNWLISPAVELPEGTASVTMYIGAQDPSWADEHYAVYAGTSADTAAMVPVIEESVSTGAYAQYEADLSEFAGETVYIAVRHFNCTDMFRLNLDQVEFWGEGGEPVVTPEPTETEPVVTPEPSEPSTGLIAGYYFETQEQVDEWTFIGTDETNWVWSDNNPGGYDYTEFAHEGGHFIMSYSFVDYVGAYQADNWAISPAVTLPEGEASVSFYASNANSTYPEPFSVYVGLTPNTADMILLQANISPTTGYSDEWTHYEIDLSDYAGETIYLAFYDNCYDCYEIWIDQVEFFGEGGEPVVTPEPTETEPPVTGDLDEALNVPGGTLHFETSAQYPWTTATEGSHFYAISGNAGVASSTSTLTTTVIAEEGDIVQFEFKAWGEGSYTFWDHCDFAVDGQVVMTYGAYDNDWEAFAYQLTAGEHTLTWSYTKDSSVNPTGDYFAVDNVYVGEPVLADEIVATESLEVPVNRTGVIEWTVLPEEAFDKEVYFTVDDPSIATVNANGVVRGVAEGETFVTVALVSDPSVYAVTEITVIDTGLTMAEIYGICTYDMGSVVGNDWVTFTDVDPGTVTSITGAPEAFGAAYAYGTVFGFTTEGVYFTAPFDNLGNVTYGASFSGGTVTSLSWDYTRGTIFGIAADDNGYSYFINVDPASGAVTTVTTNSNHFYGFCIDENGTGYGIANTGDLYAINLDTGAATLVGNTGVSCSYVQDLAYDFDTGDIYWAQILDQTNNGLYRLDKNTGAADFCGTIGSAGMEIVGMFLIPGSEPGSGDDHPVTGVTINPTEVTIHVGDTAQFTASVQPFNADNKNVEWSVDDESIIMVDQNGLVVGLAEGTAMVCVTTEEGGYQAFAIVNVIPEVGGLVEGFYFEAGNNADGFTFVDKDGDGFNWVWQEDMSITPYCTPYEGEGLIYSQSYDNDYGMALTPDNWAISPAIDLPTHSATVTLYACGQDPSYAAEHFAIYAGLTNNPDEMIQVSSEFVATGEYQQFEADLSDFTGETVYIAIRHFNVTDMFYLNVDQVEVWGDNDGPQPTHLWGDADGNGEVNSLDVLALMRHVMNLITLNSEDLDPWCDVNGDGSIDMTDALLIARYVNGAIPELPCF